MRYDFYRMQGKIHSARVGLCSPVMDFSVAFPRNSSPHPPGDESSPNSGEIPPLLAFVDKVVVLE